MYQRVLVMQTIIPLLHTRIQKSLGKRGLSYYELRASCKVTMTIALSLRLQKVKRAQVPDGVRFTLDIRLKARRQRELEICSPL